MDNKKTHVTMTLLEIRTPFLVTTVNTNGWTYVIVEEDKENLDLDIF